MSAATNISAPGSTLRRLWPPLLSVALLIGVWLEQRSFIPPPDAEPYQARVSASAARVPLEWGDWVGTDVAVPYDVIKSLQPNVLISRRYENIATGEHVWMLLVECKDARILDNHFPPACYGTAQGYAMISAQDRDWVVGDLRILGKVYEFSRRTFDPSATKTVANFLILPGGQTARDLGPVKEAAADIHRRYYGAAEVQVLFDPTTPPQQRDAIVEAMVHIQEPVLRAMAAQSGDVSK